MIPRFVLGNLSEPATAPMKKPRMGWSSAPFLVMLGLVFVLAGIAFALRGMAGLREGVREGGGLFLSVLPNLLVGFTLAGFIQVLVPQDFIVKFIGEGSGLRGLLAGTVAGALTPGGPFTHFPILASFLAKGAAVGPVSAYIASWALLGVFRIAIWELPILGPHLVMARVAACFLVPPLVGAVTALVHRWLGFET